MRAIIRQSLAAGAVAIISTSVVSCGSGSSSTPSNNSNNANDPSNNNNSPTSVTTLSGQAVDGFIVNGAIFCDNSANGKTKAAGHYTCPTGSKLVKIRGGVDVGFDENKTSSDLSFDGELVGPGSAKYITPLTTLAVELAGGEDNFDESAIPAALEKLKAVFGLSQLTLDDNPATNPALARINAQISQIISDFSWTADDYRKVMRSMSKLVAERYASSRQIDIAGGDAFDQDMRELNGKIGEDYQELFLSDATELNNRINRLKNLSKNIEDTTDVKDIDKTVVESDPQPKYVFAVRESWGVLRVRAEDKSMPIYKITEFENDQTDTQGRYLTQVSRGIQGVAYDPQAFDVEKSISEQAVSIGISVKSTTPGDFRRIDAVADGVLLTTHKGDAANVQVYAPAGLEWHFKGVKSDGTTQLATIENEEANLFNSIDEIRPQSMRVNFDSVSKWLDDRGFMDITQETGNFEMTMVISGIKFARLVGSEETPARPESFTVSVDEDRTVTGPGLKGYVTVTPSSTNADPI
ncbi:MAG: hypothetical protein ACFCUG_01335 [Thiotrichales bacterium]